jgi:uncharacterized OB-fold protein
MVWNQRPRDRGCTIGGGGQKSGAQSPHRLRKAGPKLADYKKPIPVPTPETQHFWDGCKDGKLVLQRCDDTGKAYFPPRPFSPFTGSRNVSTFEASGRAILYSYVINHRPAPGFQDDGPYAIAVVELEEGPRMMTNIVDCAQTPEALALDMALEVVFEAITDDITLPKFRPAG